MSIFREGGKNKLIFNKDKVAKIIFSKSFILCVENEKGVNSNKCMILSEILIFKNRFAEGHRHFLCAARDLSESACFTPEAIKR